MKAEQSGPLAGVTVVELEAIGPVPMAGALLSDWGADVVRVVRPGSPMTGGAVHRGRRETEFDLKKPAGREDLHGLLASADALLEGFRAGTLEKLGLDPAELVERHPGLVVGRMTGWGQDGPRSRQAGHDINYLSLTGHLAAITDRDGHPAVPLNLVADYAGGTMFLVSGVLAALLERGRSGRGQVVDAAMVDGASVLGLQTWTLRHAGRWTDRPRSNLLDGGMPWYDVYATADGRHLALGALEPAFYAELLEGLGLQDLPDRSDPAGWPRIRTAFAETIGTRPLAHWEAVFADSDACATPVRTYEEALSDSHLAARGTFTSVDGVVQPAPAPRFSRTPAGPPRPYRTAREG